jgi:hypothetical protein
MDRASFHGVTSKSDDQPMRRLTVAVWVYKMGRNRRSLSTAYPLPVIKSTAWLPADPSNAHWFVRAADCRAAPLDRLEPPHELTQ